MPQPQSVSPVPFAASGGPVGVLLIHGFTGSAAETSPMGRYLAERGLTVSCPLLPGHGTSAQDLTRISWRTWTAAVDGALQALRPGCEQLFVGGLSLGSLLTMWLGAQHPDIAGLIVMAPAIKLQNRLLPASLALRYAVDYSPVGAGVDNDLTDATAAEQNWCYDQVPMWGASEVYLLQRQVRRLLPRIRQPILIFQGRHDSALAPQAAHIVHDRVASADKTVVWLEASGHNVLIDSEKEAVWEQSYRWIVHHAG